MIDHGSVDGLPLFSRYGHVENIRVVKGQTVQAGEPIAAVGNGEGQFTGDWMALGKADNSEKFVSRNPPG